VLIRKYMTCTMIAGAIAATTFLSGCTTTPDAAVAQSTDAFNKSLAEADAAAAAATGDKSAAIRQYQKIATDNPTRGEPWSRIAQIYFNEGRYSLAISAAEETLRRDPASRQAKSITAVGGLRLAARSSGVQSVARRVAIDFQRIAADPGRCRAPGARTRGSPGTRAGSARRWKRQSIRCAQVILWRIELV
jgi:tetratricopeptide (TPR) repeat protein